MMNKNPLPKELEILFAEIDRSFHVPFDKLEPLDDNSQHDNVKKLHLKKKDDLFPKNKNIKSKVELQKLFLKIDKLCPELPPKLTGLEEFVGEAKIQKANNETSKNLNPKTRAQQQNFLKEIDDFSQIKFPSNNKLTGLEESESSKSTVKNYPKTKDELNTLLKEIDDYFQLNLTFKLGGLDEKDELFDEPVKCSTTATAQNQTTLLEGFLEKKRKQFQQNYSLRNKPVPTFPFKNIIKVNKNVVEKPVEEPEKKRLLKSKPVKKPPKRKPPKESNPVSRKYVDNFNSKAKTKTIAKKTVNLKIPSPIYDCKSIQSYYRNIMAASKSKPPEGAKIKAKRKQKELADFSDSDYGSFSDTSSPASSFSSSSGSTSCSTKSFNSLISTCNSNGKTIYLYNQYEKFLERKNMKVKGAVLYQPIYMIEPVDRHQKVIKWTCKEMDDGPSTPKFSNCSETPPISPRSMDDNGELLDLNCFQDSSPMTTKKELDDNDTSNFDQWLSNNF